MVTILQPGVLPMPSYFTPLTSTPTARSARSKDQKCVTCPHCSKTFGSVGNLKKHKVGHNKEKGPMESSESDNTYHAKGPVESAYEGTQAQTNY